MSVWDEGYFAMFRLLLGKHRFNATGTISSLDLWAFAPPEAGQTAFIQCLSRSSQPESGFR